MENKLQLYTKVLLLVLNETLDICIDYCIPGYKLISGYKLTREQHLKKPLDATKFTIVRSAVAYADNTATLSTGSSLVIARGRAR